MNHQIVLEALKKTLKNKKMSYKVLADEIGMSESGLKKLLNAKDISLNRLSQITNALGVSLADLMDLAHEEDVKSIRLSKNQEKALLADNTLLRVLWRMTVENKNEAETIKIEKITRKTLTSSLLKLENLDLIRPIKSGKVVSVHNEIYRWANEGKLVQKINQDWSITTLNKTLKNLDQSFHQLSFLQLSSKSKKQLMARLQELADEFARTARRDKMKLANKDLLPVSLLIAAAPTGPLD